MPDIDAFFKPGEGGGGGKPAKAPKDEETEVSKGVAKTLQVVHCWFALSLHAVVCACT
jgi:hypothetical protein